MRIPGDLTYAARLLRRKPSFTVAAILSLALGIGASTAIFSLVDAVLVRSLRYPEPERLVEFREISPSGAQMDVAEPNFLDVRERSRTIQTIAEYAGGPVTVIGGLEPVLAQRISVSRGFFDVLGSRPMLGRTFADEESAAGGAEVAVVGHGFWQRMLGGGEFSGRILKIDNRNFEVIGVMPPGFAYPEGAEIWIPRELSAPCCTRSAQNWSAVARLAKEASVDQALAEVSAIARQLKQEHGNDMEAVDFVLIPLQEYLVGSVRRPLIIILAAVGFLLLVACSNVTILLLTQATARQREFAVRSALGATRLRLARQSITENLLLSLIGGALGVAISYWSIGFLTGLNREGLPRVEEVGVDARAVIFAVGLSLLIAVLLGFVPVWRFSAKDVHSELKESGRGSSASAATHRMRGLLVVSQIALTLVLLVCAGLLGKSFYRILQINPGFRIDSAVAMELSMPEIERDEREFKQIIKAYNQLVAKGTLPDDTKELLESDPRQSGQRQFHQELLERIARLPGVRGAGSINRLPMTGNASSGTFMIDNNSARTGYAEYRLVSSGYLEAMEISLLKGRTFADTDRSNTPQVAVISESLAKRVWPNEDPIGQRIQFGNMDGDMRLMDVVGVVGDVRDRSPDRSARPTLYASALQRPASTSLAVVVRADSDPSVLFSEMRRTVRSLNPELPMRLRSLDQIFASTLDQRRFSLVIFGIFALVALMLAVTGIYGVMAYSVAQRTQEIGIRMAMGATVRNVVGLVMRQGLKLIAPGVVIGLAGSFYVTRLVASLLFEVHPAEAEIFGAIAGLMTGVALIACYIPARRASRVDPMVALRRE